MKKEKQSFYEYKMELLMIKLQQLVEADKIKRFNKDKQKINQ